MINRTALFYQAVRGPVLLITLGILFALQQAGRANLSRTWPIILIIIGVMKLLERSAGPSMISGPSAPPQGGPRL